ncbi:MAG: hypothetical protein MUO27_09950 [Sedimentisphaerales bacterium]|nr:hypothetical protein [Sedimentisphaerales bacterium]
MTNKKIKANKDKLHNIQTQTPSQEQTTQIIALAEETGASIPHWIVGGDSNSRNIINEISSNIHIVLQTEMMFNACIFAKRSCFWAAIAAIASCISVLLVLFCA